MKKLIIGAVLMLFMIVVIDWSLAFVQVRSLGKLLGDDDVLLALSHKLKPGFTRQEAEKAIEGYKQVEARREDDSLTVAYGYWFGFLPPLSKSGLKYMGEIEVVYSKDGRVVKASRWIN